MPEKICIEPPQCFTIRCLPAGRQYKQALYLKIRHRILTSQNACCILNFSRLLESNTFEKTLWDSANKYTLEIPSSQMKT